MIYRDDNSKSVILLVHGIAGHSVLAPLATQLVAHPQLTEWDIRSFEYEVRWWPRWLRYRLVGAPRLGKVAEAFATACRATLNQYRSIAILAHSAGGLVVQRAILDDEWLQERTSHLALFGTPSDGVRAAGMLGLVSSQLRDVAPQSTFIAYLRDRRDFFLRRRPFAMRVVNATQDVTVPRESVFADFPRSIQRTLLGDHVSMIQPSDLDHPAIGVVVNLLTSPKLFLSYVREDEDIVVEVFRRLEEREMAPWVDQRKLDIGAVWETEIMVVLRASERILVFVSAKSTEELARKGVFRSEVDTAIALQEERGREKPFIIPVRIEEIEIPEILVPYQCFDLFSSDADGLADALENVLMNPS